MTVGEFVGRFALALSLFSTQACYMNVRPDAPRPVALQAKTGAAVAELAPCSPSPVEDASEQQREEARLLNSEATQASESGDMIGALMAWRRSAALDPQHIETWRNLAVAAEESSRVGDAIAAYCAIESASPGSPDARVARLRAAQLAHGRMPERAISQFEFGMSLAQEFRWDEALTAYNAAISEAPAWPDALLNRALVREQDEDFRGAVRDLNRYLVLYPSAPERPLVAEKIDALQIHLRGERKFSFMRTFLLTAPVGLAGSALYRLLVRAPLAAEQAGTRKPRVCRGWWCSRLALQQLRTLSFRLPIGE
ncbi:MAG: tetratricopeptide repeat protein [Candidatus Poribacteria bacterium]